MATPVFPVCPLFPPPGTHAESGGAAFDHWDLGQPSRAFTALAPNEHPVVVPGECLYAHPQFSHTAVARFMNNGHVTFGRAIREARKRKALSLKSVAARIHREDGQPISPQYLNDIEHDRRSPSSDLLVQQFAQVLEIHPDWLYYLTGRIPEDVRRQRLSEVEVVKRMKAFRRGLPKGDEEQ